jgi:hypothetical protein
VQAQYTKVTGVSDYTPGQYSDLLCPP